MLLITTIIVMIFVTYESYLLLCIGTKCTSQDVWVKNISLRTFCLLVALTVAEGCQHFFFLEIQSINAKTQSTDNSAEGPWANGNKDATGGQGGLLPYAAFWDWQETMAVTLPFSHSSSSMCSPCSGVLGSLQEGQFPSCSSYPIYHHNSNLLNCSNSVVWDQAHPRSEFGELGVMFFLGMSKKTVNSPHCSWGIECVQIN